MDLSLGVDNLREYVGTQLNVFFPDKKAVSIEIKALQGALYRLEHCFSKIRFYQDVDTNQVFFNHLYSDQYLVFLWFLSSQIWLEKKNVSLCAKIYYLNKTLHAFDCMYSNNLPSIFYIAHGIGIVLGKASYSDYLYVCKGATVGASRGGAYPTLKERVSLGADSTVIGDLTLEYESTVGAGVCLFNQGVKAGMAAIRGANGELIYIPQRPPLSEYIFID